MNTELDDYILEQQKLLAEMVANSKRDLELRELALKKQDELTRSNILRAQADEALVTERKITNHLAEEHNAVITELIVKLTRVLVYLENGTYPQKIEEIIQSQNLTVKALESLTLISVGKGNISTEDLLELIRRGVIQDNTSRSKSGLYAVRNDSFNADTFVSLLMNCLIIANNLDDLINEIRPIDIKNQIKGTNHKTKIIQLVTAIGNYNAWIDLVRVLDFLEGESLGVISVKEYLRSMYKI